VREHRYGAVEKLFNDILPAAAESLPHAVGILRARGHFRARRGHFREAAADYARAIELDPARVTDWHRLAVLLVESSQIDAYREHCRKSVERFRNTTEPFEAVVIAEACLILPDSGIELSVAVQLISLDVSATNHEEIAWFELAKGLAEYRQDHFTNAIKWMQKLLDRGGGILERDALAETVLAMAQQRLKRTDEARAALANARKITDTGPPKSDANDLGGRWYFLLTVRALMREAQALVEGGPG
jgi:tetratricopeptide (TPR) repeat protein